MGRLISVVVPVYNEAEGISKFLDDELLPTLMGLKYDFEIVIVDDGSIDKTLEKVRGAEIFRKIPCRVVVLTRNFGKEVALTAGLQEAFGDAVIMIDSDGQHPVEAIPEMILRWEKGAMVVTAVRKHNSTKHRLGSRVYYRLMKTMGSRDLVVGAMDFRLIDREVVDEFCRLDERNRLTRGLIDWLGFPQEYIVVKTKGRLSGKPSYSFKKLMALTIDSMASSSRTPLVVFGYIGGFIMVFSLILGLFILIEQYIMGDPLELDWSGAVAMSVFVSFLVGLVLVSQSMTALYVAQIHTEAKGRPLYIINKKRSFESGSGGGTKAGSRAGVRAGVDKKERK
ncbi:glycosyltransferase family 2 protein [Candidatus Saccharibacteria bacterium]|nr:glycosyltransferase family 2 protein [Candidatus Saccharibacteria bacterium]